MQKIFQGIVKIGNTVYGKSIYEQLMYGWNNVLYPDDISEKTIETLQIELSETISERNFHDFNPTNMKKKLPSLHYSLKPVSLNNTRYGAYKSFEEWEEKDHYREEGAEVDRVFKIVNSCLVKGIILDYKRNPVVDEGIEYPTPLLQEFLNLYPVEPDDMDDDTYDETVVPMRDKVDDEVNKIIDVTLEQIENVGTKILAGLYYISNKSLYYIDSDSLEEIGLLRIISRDENHLENLYQKLDTMIKNISGINLSETLIEQIINGQDDTLEKYKEVIIQELLTENLILNDQKNEDLLKKMQNDPQMVKSRKFIRCKK